MDGSNNLTIQNGTVGTAATALMIHQMGTGTMNLSATLATTTGSVIKNGGGKLIVSGTNTNTGVWDLREGVVSIGAASNLGASTAGVTFNGGTLQVTGNVSLSAAPIVVRTGRGTVDVTSGNTLTIATNMTAGSGQGADRGLDKTGAGTLALTAANTGYTGSTFVSEGTLLLSGTGHVNNSSEIVVANGATLRSTSSVAVTRALSLSEGATISGNGSYTPSAMAISADLSNGFTQISMPGLTLTEAGSLAFTLTGITAGNYTLFSAAVAGTFSGATINGYALSNGGSGTTWTGSLGGFNYTFNDTSSRTLAISAIPEPATWLLLAIAGTFLTITRRRRMN